MRKQQERVTSKNKPWDAMKGVSELNEDGRSFMLGGIEFMETTGGAPATSEAFTYSNRAMPVW